MTEAVYQAFHEIHRQAQGGSSDYGRILALSDTILTTLSKSSGSGNGDGLDADERKRMVLDAFHCRLTSLIHQSKHKEALESFPHYEHLFSAALPLPLGLEAAFAFERSYCLYRLHELDKALQVLSSSSVPREVQNAPKVQQLRAQILYRQEAFEACMKEYKNLFAQQKDLNDAEHMTNYLAALAGLSLKDPTADTNDASLPKPSTFELFYNAACIDIARNKLASAIDKLAQAEALCEQTLKEEGYDETDILSEVAVIRVQRAVALHLQGNVSEALKIYNSVIKEKPSDVAVMAVASNNVIATNKDRNTFESEKMVKALVSEGLDKKLNSFQRKAFAVNRCLLLLHMNQTSKCRELVKSLQKEFPDFDILILVLAFLHVKEKDMNAALELLQSYANEHPSATEVNLTLAQNQLANKEVGKAIQSLSSITSLQNRLGMVATLVHLHEKNGDVESAEKAFKSAIAYWSAKSNASQQTITVLRQAAKFHLRHKQFARAKELFEELVRRNRKDEQAFAELTLAASHVAPAEAEQYAANLPVLASTEAPLDVDALENVSSKVSFRSRDKPLEETDSQGAAKAKGALDKKKKKKKKRPVPKSFDPNVKPDPERWLPKRERSFYKKGKKIKRDLNKSSQGSQGSQGAASQDPNTGLGSTGSAMIDGRTVAPLAPQGSSSSSSSSSASASTTTTATPSATATASAPAPEQKKQQPHKNHKKKKH